MFTHIWAALTERHSWKTFVFVHAVELVGIVWFVVMFYAGTLFFSLINIP